MITYTKINMVMHSNIFIYIVLYKIYLYIYSETIQNLDCLFML